ncbi:hypothetical protein ACFYXQ_46910 [Nocardia jiangxiensis]|uniref:XRE family transcriptional regulator n=1 Tax=Nocardia jiangxiensis TaxID=282685 RepID=A0ABW6SG38_9NOCA
MRKSVRDFAALLGLETTTVNNWRTGLSRVTPRSSTQAILDTTLDLRASDDDRARFEQIVREGEAVWRARHPAISREPEPPDHSGPHGATDRDIVVDSVQSASLADDGGDPTNRRAALRVLGIGGIAASPGLRDVVLDAARDSAQLMNAIDRSPVDPDSLRDAAEDLYQLATDYAVKPDLARIFVRLTILRDQLAATIQQAGRVADLKDLYVLFAATCTLLASVSHDLAQPSAAMIQTRAAGRFAELAGYEPLRAWVYCTRAMITSWWGTPKQVLNEVARAGAVTGISGIRLAGLEARAHAQLGNRPAALAAVDAARHERAHTTDSGGLTALGPIFDFSPARQHYYDATTFTHLHDWSNVEREAATVIGLYAPTHAATWPATLTLAQINLAHARLHNDGPSEAFEALQSVFTIPTGQRIPQVVTALHAVRNDLAAHPATPSADGRMLAEAIDTFVPATAMTKADNDL